MSERIGEEAIAGPLPHGRNRANHDKIHSDSARGRSTIMEVEIPMRNRLFLIVTVLMFSSVGLTAELPAVPVSLTTTVAPNQVILSWPASSGATGYRVSRGIAGGVYTHFVDLGVVTGYTDTAVKNATPYFYVVAAKNAAGSSANSVQVSATPGTYTGAPFLIAPAHESKPLLGMSFEWSDPAIYTSYVFVLIDRATDMVVHTASLSATDGPCSSGTTCILSPGMTGYPPPTILDTRNFRWTVLGNGTWAIGGVGNYNYIHPMLPEVSAVAANWVGNTVNLNWPTVPGAVSYHASFMNWAFVTSSELYQAASACVGAACEGTADVSQIPFGTVHMRLEVCGANGVCTTGVTTDVYKTCPAALPEPALVTPTEGAVVNRLTSVRWFEQSTAEQYSIQFQKDEGGTNFTIVKDDVLWRSQVACKKKADGNFCGRTYGLSNGNYLALISAQCGGTWGPQKIVSFTVNNSGVPAALVAPAVLSPASDATTSIQPVILWSKIADIENYELVVTDSNGIQSAQTAKCKTAICAFDYAVEGLKLQGTYAFAVRINEPGMPSSPTRLFTASLSYVAPTVAQTGPYPSQNVNSSNTVSIEYDADVQVPFSSITITGPSAYSYSSPNMARSSCAFVKTRTGVVQRCSVTSALLGAPGLYISTVKAGTLNTMSGGSVLWTPPSPPTQFRRDAPPAGVRSIYSVFAQNTQFLPESGPFGHGGGASSAWGLSDRQRAGKLRDYVSSKQFDVVALSEVFVWEAQDELAKVMKFEYPFFAAHIDTAGIASVDEAFAEQDSGLAIFSKFPPVFVAPGATSNYQGTSDTLNEIDDVDTTAGPFTPIPPASFKLNDYMWYKQYGQCEGTDCKAAKAFAGIRLANPKTGAPLFIAWTHTQSATDNITDSYEALAHQVNDDARPVMKLMLAGAPAAYDALILGDWNLNMPASVGRHPKFNGVGTNSQVNGGGDLSALYSLDSVDHADSVFDPKNPHFDALLPDPPAAVGEPAGGLPKTVFQQYRLTFDPRHANPPFPEFYDLWLENPIGDPGLTFDVTGRRSHIACSERDRETCGQRHYGDSNLDKFDTGSRYDSVLARFSKSNIPNAPGSGNYPNAPVNWELGSCVQHVSLARDYLYSDHFGTIIEVGPVAPLCNPATAKADPQLWRVPNSMPLPDANKRGFDKEAGVHDGNFAHGGANQWFYIKDPGAFDIINEGSDATMNGVIVEAYLANDLSDPIAIADATQHVDGFLPGSPGCNKEINDFSIGNQDPEKGGVIADACAGADTRVTYRVPQGGLYLRIVPADPARPGKRCETCTGNYHLRFRERTCRAPKEAVAVSSGIFNFGLNTTEKGWFGVNQHQCWFQIELQAPTSEIDFQTLTIANIGSVSNQGCIDHALSGGTCSTGYQAEIYKSKAEAEADKPMPGTRFVQKATTPPAGTDNTFVVDSGWDLKVEPDTGRKAYYVKVTRDDPSRPHDAVLNYDSNLKSVVFQVVETTDIEDDYLFTGWLPFKGSFVVNDPFNNTDELRVRQFVNGTQIKFDDVELNVDNQGGDYFKFPDQGPDGRAISEGSKRGYGGTWKSEDKIGTWVNYTQFARVEVIEKDDFSAWDWVVADHLQCGKEGQTPPPGGWQAARFLELWNSLPMIANANGNRFSGESFDYNDLCGGAGGLLTWAYKFRAGVYRPQ